MAHWVQLGVSTDPWGGFALSKLQQRGLATDCECYTLQSPTPTTLKYSNLLFTVDKLEVNGAPGKGRTDLDS